MSNINITQDGDYLEVSSPYCRGWVARAKELGGRWVADKKVWRLPADVREQVEAGLREYYGWEPDGQLATVRITARDHLEWWRGNDCAFLGRPLARAWGRDSKVQLQDGVSLLAGRFYTGGSAYNWKIFCDEGTQLLVRDVPAAAVARLAVEGGDGDWQVEVVDHQVDRQALEAERERLLARLAEIERLLEGGAS